MAKIGILCDGYKVARFRQTLIEHGFDDFEVTREKGLSLIKVETDMSRQQEIHAICKTVELHFKTFKN